MYRRVDRQNYAVTVGVLIQSSFCMLNVMLPSRRSNFAELPAPQACSRRSFLLTPFPVCPVIGLSCPRNKIPLLAKTAATLARGWTEILSLENVQLHTSFCALYVCLSLVLLISNKLSSTRKLISCTATRGREKRRWSLPPRAPCH